MSDVDARLNEHQERLDDHDERLGANERAIFGGLDPVTNQRQIGALEKVDAGISYLRSIKNAVVWGLRGAAAFCTAMAGTIWYLIAHLGQIVAAFRGF